MAADPFALLRARFAEKNPLVISILSGDRQRALELVRQDPAAAVAATCCRGFTPMLAAVLVDDGELVEVLCSAGFVDTALTEISWQSLENLAGGELVLTDDARRGCQAGRTALGAALSLDRQQAVKALLTAALRTPYPAHLSPFVMAKRLPAEQRLQAVQQLLDNGLDPLRLDPSDASQSPLVLLVDDAGNLMLEAVLGREQQQAQQAQRQQDEQFGGLPAGDAAQAEGALPGSSGCSKDQDGAAGGPGLTYTQLTHALYSALQLGHAEARTYIVQRMQAAHAAAAAALRGPSAAATAAAAAAAAVEAATAASGLVDARQEALNALQRAALHAQQNELDDFAAEPPGVGAAVAEAKTSLNAASKACAATLEVLADTGAAMSVPGLLVQGGSFLASKCMVQADKARDWQVAQLVLGSGLDSLELSPTNASQTPLSPVLEGPIHFCRRAGQLMLDAVLSRAWQQREGIQPKQQEEQQQQVKRTQPEASSGAATAGTHADGLSGAGREQAAHAERSCFLQLVHGLHAALQLGHPAACEQFVQLMEAACGAAAGIAQPAQMAAVRGAASASALAVKGLAVNAVPGLLDSRSASVAHQTLHKAASQQHWRAVLVLLAAGVLPASDDHFHSHGSLVLRAAEAEQWGIVSFVVTAMPATHSKAVLLAAERWQPRTLAQLLHRFGLPRDKQQLRQQLLERQRLLDAGQQLPLELRQVALEDQPWLANPLIENMQIGAQNDVWMWLRQRCPLFALLHSALQHWVLNFDEHGEEEEEELEHDPEGHLQRMQCAMVLLRAGYSADELQRLVERSPHLRHNLGIDGVNRRLWELCTSGPAALDWSPATHGLYPSRFRDAARTVLLVAAAQQRRRLLPPAVPLLGCLPTLEVHHVLQLAALPLHEWL